MALSCMQRSCIWHALQLQLRWRQMTGQRERSPSMFRPLCLPPFCNASAWGLHRASFDPPLALMKLQSGFVHACGGGGGG